MIFEVFNSKQKSFNCSFFAAMQRNFLCVQIAVVICSELIVHGVMCLVTSFSHLMRIC